MFVWDVSLLVLLVVVSLLVLTGWGRIGLRILHIKMPPSFEIHIGWLGFSLLLGFLEIIHLFVAINWQVTLFVFGVGVAGFLLPFNSMRWSAWSFILRSRWPVHIYLVVLISLIFFVVWLLRSMGLANNYDSGIYHFGSIRWVNEYPIVPGLGNVFTALAYNQSYFLYLGLLNITPFWNHGYALGGLVLLVLTGLTLIQFCLRSSNVLRWTFGVPVFVFMGYIGGTLSNPSPDTAVNLLQIVMYLSLVALYVDEKPFNNQRQLLLATLILLSITIVTIKVSSAMFALTLLGLALVYAKRDFYLKGHWKFVLVLGAIIGVTHLVRGYILSGAPLYPSGFAAVLSLPWAMSSDAIFGERFWIYVWSRWPGASPGEVIGSWNWFPHWLNALTIETWIVFTVLVSLLVVNACMLVVNKTSLPKRRRMVLSLPLLTSIVFWFMSAPQIRFLGAIPLLLLCLNLWIFWERKR